MSRRVHIPVIGATASILDTAPLFCGKRRERTTLVTIFSYLATCSRCIKSSALAEEAIEYRRVQAKLRRDREAQEAA